jgi:hypothetical protein
MMSTPVRTQTNQSTVSPQGNRVLLLQGFLIVKVIAIARKVTVVKRTNESCTYLEVKVMFAFEEQVL